MVPASAYRHLSRKVQPPAGRSKGKKGKEKSCAYFITRNGFLNTRFIPVRENKYPILKNHRVIEKEFFNSLSNLYKLYEVEMPCVNSQPFPVNIALAFRAAKEWLKKLAPELELVILHDENHRASLATIKTFETGNTLYYIPVRPLTSLLKQKKNRQLTNLILAVFSYLYNVVEVPWFTEDYTFLSDCYSVLQQWHLEQDDPECQPASAEALAHFKMITRAGKSILKKITLTACTKSLKKQTEKFMPLNDNEKLFHAVAIEMNLLAEKFPERSIFSGIPENMLHPDAETRMSPEHYLSFFWDSEDILYDDLMHYIDSHLQECNVVDNPAAIQYFDEPQDRPLHDLEFETRLFKAMDELCTALNDIKHD